MQIDQNVWKEDFVVRSYEVEPGGWCSVQTICNYLQEAAANHAHFLELSVEHLQDKRLFWVLARLRVKMALYPTWRELVQVETWPSGENGLYATREFMIYDDQHHELGRASSSWILVDTKSRRPVRIPSFVSDLRGANRESPFTSAPVKLVPLSRCDHEQQFSVRYSDLDLNQHTNNVRYIDWAVETIPRNKIESLFLTEINVNFRAETVFEDGIVSRIELTHAQDELTIIHGLSRSRDQKDVALLRSHWIPRPYPS